MPEGAGARQRTGAGVAPLLTPALGAVLLTAFPEDGGRQRDGGGCGPRTVASWSAAARVTAEFARYGDDAARADDWTGGDDGKAASRATSSAYVARVPRGRLADPGAWRYWDGTAWGRGAGRAAPVLGDERRTGVGSAFSVVRADGTYVLCTMAAGGAGLTTVTSYAACSPTAPWHGPARDFRPPLPGGEVAAYLSAGCARGCALPTVGAAAHVNADVSRYRPRFVTLRLSPAR
ncbi:hypothetical protein [Streptomyces flavalbus]|uniref:DUF4185 domain-containing protein n=1 Tax=Streptomyces flavalbus TaxID=2665155 RepID=A0ABW2WFY0_9ACTN